MTKQSKALRLADELYDDTALPEWVEEVAEELRRLHAENEALKAERDQWKDDAINGGNAQYLRDKLAAAEARLAKSDTLLRQVLEFLERRSMGAEHLITALRERLGGQK